MRHKFLEVCGCCLALALAASAAPSILTPPQSITVNNASDASFTVVATNAASYQWQFQRRDLSGATNATLGLQNVTNGQGGSYTVVVTAPDNTFVSSSATLTIVAGTVVQFAISGYPGGVTNYLNVQLFDHDKPATVQNFIHYIEAGGYTNLFWSRCIPGFVLQGGDYGAENRTSATLLAYDVYEYFTVNLSYNNPPFPWQVDNEFNVGPVIHNTFGTLAMAKESGEPDSAAQAFFFNLADNSTNLDNENGGFTVFGRVLSGTNVLDYFNGLSKPANGIYDSGVLPFTDLPVNYASPAVPGDSNLFFVDFTFVTQPMIDTVPPTVSMTYPANGTTITNANLMAQGTASDNVGLARIYCNFFDSFGFDDGAFGGEATGTTNWSYDAGNLPPGTYTTDMVSQDGAGNLSSPVETSFIVPRFPFSAVANGPGTISPNLDGTNTAIGSSFTVRATAKPGAQFVSWTSGGTAFLSPRENFVMANGLQLTANFVPNSIPGGISFLEPGPNAELTNPIVSVKGKISAGAGAATVTCQFFAKSGISVGSPMVVSGTDTWSLTPTLFNPGQYVVQAVARDSSGGSTVISQSFTVLSPLTVITNGTGTTSLASGLYQDPEKEYTIKATPQNGSLFYEWSDGTSVWNSPIHSFTNSAGLTLMATFVNNELLNSISFTYPTSEVATDKFSLAGTVSPTVVAPQVACQLFLKNAAVGASQPAVVSGTNWSLAVSNLTQGAYTAVAVVTDSSGKQSLVSQDFTVNFYPAIAGNYYGLFLPTQDINSETAGHFVLTVTRSGTFTMRTIFADRAYNVSASLGTSGSFAWEAGGFNGELYSGFEVDLTEGTGKVSGYVEYATGLVANLLGYRAVTNLSSASEPAVGNYVFNLTTITNQEAGGPTNDGYATLSVASTGQLKLTGALADNTSFSEAVGVSKDGIWPVFSGLYQGRGMLIGWETNQPSGAAAGSLLWIKSPVAGSYYPNGLAIQASFTGTNFIPPASGTQYQVVFSGGALNPPLTNTLTVNNGQFASVSGTANNLAISLSNVGVLTGSFSSPGTGKTIHFKGAFTSPVQGGSGFVLDTGNQTGSFTVGLAP
jgi:cyclophilin family peptidyl-prolyl cis-trans isomerase